MAVALSKFVAWRVPIDQAVVGNDVTSIFVQATGPAPQSINTALKADGDSFLGDEPSARL